MSFERLHLRWLLLAIAAVVLVLHSLAYNFVTDDAYISFVFSRNLAEHGELTFNLGQPVEGYTNFLWTVILGLGMILGVPPELSSRVLGTACALGTLYVVFRVTERALGRKSAWAAVPSLLLASSSGFACWTSGGLETQLFTLLVAIALDGVVAATEDPRALRRAAIALALSAMTRPEGLLVAGLLGIVHVLGRVLGRRADGAPRGIRPEVIAALCFLVVWAPWFGWRCWYYGHLWPNTYYVKASGRWSDPRFELEMVKNGAHYIWVWATQTRVLLVLPIIAVGLIAGAANRARFVLAMACTLLGIVYVVYAITVGGDFMGLHRFVMPVFVIAAIALTLGLEWLTSRTRRARMSAVIGLVFASSVVIVVVARYGRVPAMLWPWSTEWRVAAVLGALLLALLVVPDAHRRLLAAFVAVLVVGGFAAGQYALTRTSTKFGNNAPDRGIDTPAYLMVYTEDRAAIGRAMEACFRPDDFSIVGGAGAQPYLGRMRAIDVFGLVSERIAHEEPRIRPRAGHTKFGNDRLLADYDPTFVFSCYAIHAKATPQPRLGCGGFWLARGFEQITMHIPGMRQQGEYYTFLARKDRNFQCPGRVQ